MRTFMDARDGADDARHLPLTQPAHSSTLIVIRATKTSTPSPNIMKYSSIRERERERDVKLNV